MKTVRDSKFKVSYVDSNGDESVVRLTPEAANLFEAAPDLLEAAKLIDYALLGLDEGLQENEMINSPRRLLCAAIAKAEGKERD